MPPPPAHPEEQHPIHPIGMKDADAIASFLLDTYRTAPDFAALYGIQDRSSLSQLEPEFRRICDWAKWVPGAGLSYHRDGQTGGAIIALPTSDAPAWKVYLRHPIRSALLRARISGSKRKNRSKLPPHATNRSRTYTALVERDKFSVPHIHVLALGVDPTARRQGIARTLIDAAGKQWAKYADHIVINTWHPDNVAIYEKLGFSIYSHSQEGDIQCWNMSRPTQPPREPPNN